MKILAIDPGSEQSAYVNFELATDCLAEFGLVPNKTLVSSLAGAFKPGHMVIEMLANYGAPVGKTTFDTAVWIGRFIQAWKGTYEFVYRKDIKKHFFGRTTMVRDSDIKQLLIDKYGKESTKKGGSLYGIKKDIWQALAIAVYYAETNSQQNAQ